MLVQTLITSLRWSRLIWSGTRVDANIEMHQTRSIRSRFAGASRNQVIKTFHELSPVNDFATKAEDGRPSSSSGIEWSDRPGVARQICARPPSTATSLPVMKLLSCDARKAATAPISAGSAMR